MTKEQIEKVEFLKQAIVPLSKQNDEASKQRMELIYSAINLIQRGSDVRTYSMPPTFKPVYIERIVMWQANNAVSHAHWHICLYGKWQHQDYDGFYAANMYKGLPTERWESVATDSCRSRTALAWAIQEALDKVKSGEEYMRPDALDVLSYGHILGKNTPTEAQFWDMWAKNKARRVEAVNLKAKADANAIREAKILEANRRRK